MKSSIDRWRAFVDATLAAGVPDAEWVAEVAGTYEAGAPDGLTLGRAMGLEGDPGERPWWVREQHERRRRAVQELRRAYMADLGTSAAAKEIVRLSRRRLPPSDPRKQLLEDALGTGLGIPGARRLVTILEAK